MRLEGALERALQLKKLPVLVIKSSTYGGGWGGAVSS